MGEGRPELPPPEGADSSWNQTWDRLVVELLEEYFFRRPGKSINPETAYANIHNYIREDLHRSVSDFFYRDCDRHLMNY